MALTLVFAGISRPEAPPGWRFWDTSDGLAESYTKGLVGLDGRIWLQHGDLNMDLTDGYQLSQPTHPHAVGPLCGLPDGTLWLWTGSSLKRFSRGTWMTYSVPEVTGSGSLRLDSQQNWIFQSTRNPDLVGALGLAAVSRDRVLILLPDRILEFDAGRGSAAAILLSGQTRLGHFVEIHPGRSKGIWVTGRYGLGKLIADDATNASKGSWRWTPFSRPPPTGFSELTQFLEAGNGDLFVTAAVAQGNSVLRFSAGEWHTVYTSRSATLRGWPGNDGVVWLEDGGRILQLAAGQAQPVEKVNALAGVILAVRPEDDGSFLVGTSQGVARYSPPPWRPPVGLHQVDELVNAIIEDRQGRIWFAAASQLICLDGETWHTYPLPQGQQTWPVYTESMAALPDGTIAIRSIKDSPLTFDPRTGRFGVLKHPEGREIRLFVPHPEGMLVQSFVFGDRSRFRLEVYNGRTFRTIIEDNSMKGLEDVRTIRLDRSGDIWLGDTLDFAVYHKGKFQSQGAGQGYNDRGCFQVYQAPSGTLYAGGRDSVQIREGEKWRVIHSGLDRTRSILMARDGTLWVASGTGMHRYRDGNWLTNGADEGLPSSVAYRVFQDSRGRIWGATTRGIALYHPEADRDPPITFISEEQNSRQVSPAGDARLVFSGMDKWKQTPAERLLFSWRLDGGLWQPFSPDTSAAFHHLPVGSRRFEVRAMDRNGNIDPRPAEFTFSVVPPWYESRAFQVVAGLSFISIALLLVFAILSYRQRGLLIAELHRKKRLESERQAILEMVARRKPLQVIFQRIARSIAVTSPGTHAGVMRIGGAALRVAEGSPLPAPFIRELEAIPFVGMAFDELWSNLHLAASKQGLSGCHFAPIRSGGEELIGAIAVIRRPRATKPVDIPIVSTMSNLAGVAIDSARLYERLAFQAEHDALTGLPNRLMFESKLQEALEEARQNGSQVAVFFLDLDRFKQINDSLGHRAGDIFLKQVAQRLSDRIPVGQTLARIGGDEFTLVLREQPGTEWAEQTADRMLKALRAPIVVEGHNLFASASIGISVYPRDGEDHTTLQKRADVAMYRAKALGKNRFEFFSAEMDVSTATTMDMEPALRAALDQGRFELHYQPQFNMDGRLAGLEAMLRLNHPDLGLIHPDHFLQIAEETGLIAPIGEWVLREVCLQIQRWKREGRHVPKVSINVSEVQFRALPFAGCVARVLRETEVSPQLLELELTESTLMNHSSESASQMQRLRSLGVRIAMDHFGAGFSSLTAMRRLPVNVLNTVKIDHSFIDTLDAPLSSLPLVQGIITLVREMGLAVVVPGIERPRQYELLRGIHQGAVQGYLLARPQPAHAIEELLVPEGLHSLESAIGPAAPVGELASKGIR